MDSLTGRGQRVERGHQGVADTPGVADTAGPTAVSGPTVARAPDELDMSARGSQIIGDFKQLAQVLENTQCQPQQPLYAALMEHYGQNKRDTEAEIHLTLTALKSLYALKKSIGPQEGILAAIMPQNMPLYSLVLYALMPAILKQEVAVHLPQDHRTRFSRIYRAVAGACAAIGAGQGKTASGGGLGRAMPELETEDFLLLANLGRIRWDISCGPAPAADHARLHSIFVDRWKDHADIFIVTGSFEAARQVAISCPSTTLTIYNCSGINPVVIPANPRHPDTPGVVRPIKETIRAIAERLVNARMLHNGQDCGAPDAIFVHQDQSTNLIDALKAELILRGDADQLRVVRNKVNYQQAAMAVVASACEADSASHLEFGGDFKASTLAMSPAIIFHDLGKYSQPNRKLKIREFYAPVFNVFKYQEEQDLALYFKHPDYENSRMFLSLFGDMEQTAALRMNHTVLYDQTVIDYDNVTVDYGGPGMQASGFIRDHQIYPQAINPMSTIARHQRLKRENKLGYSAIERTKLASAAFNELMDAVPEAQREHLLWAYFWQYGKEHSVMPRKGKKPGRPSAGQKENTGPAVDTSSHVSTNLRSDAPLGVVFVVKGEKNKDHVLLAIKKFLRKKRAHNRSGHEGGDCGASYVAQAAGLPRHASDRTFIVSTDKVEEALKVAERKVMGEDFSDTHLSSDDLQNLLVVEALAATSRLGTPAVAEGSHRALDKRARACVPLLKQMVEHLCASKGDILLEGMQKDNRKTDATISFGHCQGLCMRPEGLLSHGRLTPLSCSPV